MIRHACVCWLLLSGTTAAFGNSIAQECFEELSFDFGAVPRGQQLTHPFRIINKTGKTLQIGQVRSSCNRCSAARVLQTSLGPGEETVLVVQMFAGAFVGPKEVTVYVHFVQPKAEEVRISVRANSREDVFFNPDALTFGKIKRGTGASQSMTITFFDPAVKILEAKCDSNYVQVAVKELKGKGGESSYHLEAKIRPDTPAGKWYSDIWLTTNHMAMPKLRVSLTVEIEAALSVSPSSVSLGAIKAGAESDRKVVIRSAKPFRIVGITGTDSQLQVREAKSESKTVHILTVTVRPLVVGELRRTIRVQTDILNGGDIEFETVANIVP
ncbi:MAG: DUF1573 domain-containing protein [Gemmataceae bacterium]|nr:DUF1573 domain-containing protein [Gemmataceae bacterium]